MDTKLQMVQNILVKAACPLLYLLDLFIKKSSKKEGMSKDEIGMAIQWCRDTYQLTQVAFSDKRERYFEE